MKHTKGKVTVKKEITGMYISNESNIDICQISIPKNSSYIMSDEFQIERKKSEQSEANANLIAEAFNVTNECGLTPRQLLEHNNKMLEALKELQKQFNENGLMTGHLFELCQKAIVNY